MTSSIVDILLVRMRQGDWLYPLDEFRGGTAVGGQAPFVVSRGFF